MNSIRNIRRTLAAALVVAAAALCAPATSLAGTLTINSGVLDYTGAPAEANHVKLWFLFGYYMIQDDGASMTLPKSTTQQGCQASSPQLADCPYGSLSSITVHLGNGGSSAQDELALTPVTLYAGGGNDTLTGGGGNVTLVGGPGTDTLNAGSGTTRLVAGTGATTFNAGSGHGTYDGGPAADTINARNGVAEDVTCGGGIDTVAADADDSVASDCETVDRGIAAGTTGTSGGDASVPGGLTGAPSALLPPEPKISSAPVTLTSNGAVPVTLSCPATAVRGCQGTITIAPAAGGRSSAKIMAARRVVRRRAPKGGKRFNIKAGHKAVIRVPLSRRTTRFVRARRHARGRIRFRVTVSTRTEAGTHRSVATIVARAARRRPTPARHPRR